VYWRTPRGSIENSRVREPAAIQGLLGGRRTKTADHLKHSGSTTPTTVYKSVLKVLPDADHWGRRGEDSRKEVEPTAVGSRSSDNGVGLGVETRVVYWRTVPGGLSFRL